MKIKTKSTDIWIDYQKTKETKVNIHCTIDASEMKSSTGDYYKQLYIKKLGNLKEMDKFQEIYKLLWLNQEELKPWKDQLLFKN